MGILSDVHQQIKYMMRGYFRQPSRYISDQCSCNVIALTVLITVAVVTVVIVIQFPYVSNNADNKNNSISEIIDNQENLIRDLMDEVERMKAQLDVICNCSSAVLSESANQSSPYDDAIPSPSPNVILSPNVVSPTPPPF